MNNQVCYVISLYEHAKHLFFLCMPKLVCVQCYDWCFDIHIYS